MASFVELLPNVDDLLALEVEDLSWVVLDVMPSLLQMGMVHTMALVESAFPPVGVRYPDNRRRDFANAIAEAIGWLVAQGIIVQVPDQAAGYMMLTRRGRAIGDRTGVRAYMAARTLPAELLHPALARVRPHFMRGDYEVAVGLAFKIVEVAVRNAANQKGAGFAADDVGVDLMRRAFHPERGVLADQTLVGAEREAMSSMFAGAIGHAKNPTGHRHVEISAPRAARLILWASHLLDLVDELAP